MIAFMESAAGHQLDDAGVGLAHQLYRETDGNPFFVAEVLRNLSESGEIVQDATTGRWTANDTEGPLSLPPQRAGGHRHPGLHAWGTGRPRSCPRHR